MADVFISYSRADWAVARALADHLTEIGLSVWWDDELVGGEAFRDTIDAELDKAKSVIVIWSADSAQSVFVKDEASRSLKRKRLIQTCLTDFDLRQLPIGFGQDHVILITERDRLLKALAAKDIVPPKDTAASDKAFEAKVSQVMKERTANLQTDIKIFLPAIALIGGLVVGFVIFVFAYLIGVDSVVWAPSDGSVAPKQVGYMYALNWSFADLIIFPVTFALLQLGELTMEEIRTQLIQRRMILTTEFEPLEPEDKSLARLWRTIRRGSRLFSIALLILCCSFAFIDYYRAVGQFYVYPKLAAQLNQAGSTADIPLAVDNSGRDWSVAALLERSDGKKSDPLLNSLFAALVYLLYPALGVGAIFAFYFTVFGIGLMFLPGVMRYYRLQIVPDLNSKDSRCGFEIFSPFFSYAVSISALCFVLAYLMAMQNMYIRVPASTLAVFLSPHIQQGLMECQAGQTAKCLDNWFGYVFSDDVPISVVKSAASWFVGILVVVLLLGFAYLFLRVSALAGRKQIEGEIRRFGNRRLRRLTEHSPTEIQANLEQMRTWPLRWPGLNQTMLSTTIVLTGLVFYKLGFFFSLCALVFVIYNTITSITKS